MPALPAVEKDGRFAGIFGEREFMAALFPGYVGELASAAMVSRSVDETIERRSQCAEEPIRRYLTTDHVLVEDDYSDTQLAELFLHHRVLIVPIATAGQGPRRRHPPRLLQRPGRPLRHDRRGPGGVGEPTIRGRWGGIRLVPSIYPPIVGEKLGASSRDAWALVGRQHGVVSRRDLLAIGFNARSIEHRIAKGRLHRIHAGVYAVGRRELTREGRWMAAVLACGPGAALSHHSAAAFWGFGREWARGIDVSVRRECYLRREGIRARSRPSLPADDVVIRHGIPVTTPARTIVDIATELGPSRLERAINDADKLDLIDAEEFGLGLDRFAGEPGVRPLCRLLHPFTFRFSDSDLEVAFRPLAHAAGLPPPLTKEPVNGFEVDFYWPDLGLVVETDGLRYHRTASEQTRDRLRDQTHTAAGLTFLRFTHHQVKYRRAHVRQVLAETAASIRERLRS